MDTSSGRPTNAIWRERGKLLHLFREQYGFTLEELGQRAGLSRAMLSRFEAGRRKLSEEAWIRVLNSLGELADKNRAKRAATQRVADKLGIRIDQVSPARGLALALEEIIPQGLEGLRQQAIADAQQRQQEAEFFNLLEKMPREELLTVCKSFALAVFGERKEIIANKEAGLPLPSGEQVLINIVRRAVGTEEPTEEQTKD